MTTESIGILAGSILLWFGGAMIEESFICCAGLTAIGALFIFAARQQRG